MAKKKDLIEALPPRSGKPLNVLFNLEAAIPNRYAGAEVMAHRMAKYLVDVGHNVTVLTSYAGGVIDGVKVVNRGLAIQPEREIIDIWQKADVVLTHLGQTGETQNKCNKFRKPLVHVIHNSFEEIFIRTKIKNSYVVYNSQWVKDVLKYAQNSIIVNPPVDYRVYQSVGKTERKMITLVNSNENKGGRHIIEIAKKMPQYDFLVVEGGYNEQIRDTKVKNITYIPQIRDIKEALRRTKILLALSDYESWGLAAVEAIACGIPVIANPTTGLVSSLDSAGIFIKRDDIASICEEIDSLMKDTKKYAEVSKRCTERAIELDPIPQLQEFEKYLQHIVKQGYRL